MKNIKFRYLLTVLVILITATISIPVQAKETFAERCQRRQRENNAKWLAELEADGNLTQEAIDALGGKGMTPNKVNKKSDQKTTGSTSSSTDVGKGWVFTSDELHVINLPEDERGYTKSGWYGNPE